MAHKNDYTCIVKSADGRFLKWVYVHDLLRFTQFLDREHSGWRFFNVYDRRKAVKLAQFTKNNKPSSRFI
jgi:hypothetical protein